MSTKTKNQKQQPKANVSPAQKLAPKAPAKAQVSRVVEKDAKAIENKIEQAEARPKGGRNAVMEMHGGFTSERSGRRHGHIKRMAIRQEGNGTIVHTFAGTERLSATDLLGTCAQGDIIDTFQLAPTAFGAVLPQFATPFSKFSFKKADLEWVGEAALIDVGTAGSLYIGANFNPDAELPFGEAGATTMATWYPNEMTVALRELKEHHLRLRLDQGSQIPLFVGLNGDDKFESQAKIVVAAGTILNPVGNQMPVGELFIHYVVDLYQMNAGQSDIKKGVIYGFNPAAAVTAQGILDFNQTGTIWTGDGDVITCPPPATAVSFVTDSNGTYVVEIDSFGNVAAATLTVAALQYYSVTNQPPPLGIDTSFMHTSDNSGVLAPCMDFRGAITTSSNYSNGSAAPTTPGTTNATCRRRWCFTAVAGTPFAMAPPIYSSGTATVWINVIKLDNIYHKDGDISIRQTADTTANFMVQRRVGLTLVDLKRQLTMSSQDMLKLVTYINANRSKLDAAMLDVLIVKCDLPIMRTPDTTLIVPALLAVAAWATVTFGPILAEKACRWIGRKLDGK